MKPRAKASMARRCELCTQAARRGRLCPDCKDMIRRLQGIWPDLNTIARGLLTYYAVIEQQRDGAQQQSGSALARGNSE